MTALQLLEEFKKRCACFLYRPITASSLAALQAIANSFLAELKANELVDQRLTIVVQQERLNPSKIKISIIDPYLGYTDYFVQNKDAI
jgi:hypothetical protein